MKILDASLEKVLSICACYYLAVFCVVAAMRMPFPGALEWLESSAYYQVLRILAGQSLYVEPSLEYVPSIYPPLYFYAAALIARITGPEFLGLRLVSFLSSLGSMALIGYIVYRESYRRIAGLWAAGLFAATFQVSLTYFDTARVDSLFLFLSLCSVAAIRFAPGMTGCMLSAMLLVCAALTKQTAIILSLPMFLYVFLFRSRTQALFFTGFFIVTIGLLSLWINASTQGWYFFYTIVLPPQHTIILNKIKSFWLDQLIKPLGITTCLAMSSIFLIARKKSRAFTLVYALCFITLLGVSCMHWIKIGAYKNVLPPAHAALAIGAGLALGLMRRRWVQRLLLGAACIQFALLWYNPLPMIPTARHAEIVRTTIAAIKEIDGEVFAPASGYLSVMAGKTHSAHIAAIDDILLFTTAGAVRNRLLIEIREAIRDKRFAAILLDRRFRFFQRDIEANYILCPQYSSQLTYWPLIKYWYVPRPPQP